MRRGKWKKVANVSALQIVEPTEKDASIEPSKPAIRKSKKRPCHDEVGLDEGVVIKFPSDVSVYSDPGLMLKYANQLLFPNDESFLSKIKASQVVSWGLPSAFQTNDRLVEALERLDKAVEKVVIKTKGKIMQEYLLGHTNSCNTDKDIKMWEQWKELTRSRRYGRGGQG
ncbi:hypothetical protein Ddye_001376 [Dipteronia dyeriana]|uniref:Uncharacterized protein n=1 Tax=Dipteronia dyeriana TaxID=168575 RepID=A0AAE0CTE7_9ROSI|nr:hypothetical protein Ddye_001376 [Dipteronia dyeriana]